MTDKKLAEVQLRERFRVARALRDDLSALLCVIGMNLDQVQSTSPQLVEAQRYLNNAIQKLRYEADSGKSYWDAEHL